MKTILSALIGVYTRWKYVEDTDAATRPAPTPAAETPKDEMKRLRDSLARERRNLESYNRFNCAALAGPCESSIRAMEGRLRALELFQRRAV